MQNIMVIVCALLVSAVLVGEKNQECRIAHVSCVLMPNQRVCVRPVVEQKRFCPWVRTDVPIS